MTGARLVRHLLDVDDLSAGELTTVLDLAELADPPKVLAGRGVSLVFEKPSVRTRVSMEVAVVELGGHPVSMRGDEIGLDDREPVEDVAKVLSSYTAVIGARVFAHAKVARLAASAGVPVVNLLSDEAHPCQALADLVTVRQLFGRLDGIAMAYVGDGNNVCRSLMKAARLARMEMRVAAPPGYEPPPDGSTFITSDPIEAVSGAQVVYTDVWASMGQETDAARREADFAGFTVDERLMSSAAPGARFMHCLPAHRGLEVAAEVVDGPASAVWQQAANRLTAQRGLLLWLMGAGGPDVGVDSAGARR